MDRDFRPSMSIGVLHSILLERALHRMTLTWRFHPPTHAPVEQVLTFDSDDALLDEYDRLLECDAAPSGAPTLCVTMVVDPSPVSSLAIVRDFNLRAWSEEERSEPGERSSPG